MNLATRSAVLLSSFLLTMNFSGTSFAVSIDPDYASSQCANQKGDVRACCDDMLEGVIVEVKKCIQLALEKRSQAKETITLETAAKPVPATTKHAPSGLIGTWTIEFGDTMVVTQESPEFKARFNFKDGRIIGSVNDNTMTGVWVQNSSKSKCSEKQDGSYYWGKITLKFSGDSYTGVWGYCNQGPDRKMKTGERKH